MATSTSRSLPDVPDVLHEIFAYLDPVHQSQYEYGKVYESRRSLALAARTCRGFTGSALDVLWKRLPDDQPLADLLCHLGIAAREVEDEEDLESLGDNKPGRYKLPNQRIVGFVIPVPGAEDPIKAYERRWRLSRGYDTRYRIRDIGDPRKHPRWPHFVEYASRVRTITLFAFDGPEWCRIWEELRSRMEGAPILPNVLSVAFCRFSWRALTPGAFALISPSVRKLNFNLDNENWQALDEKLRRIFTQSFNCAPEINQLRLEVPPSRFGPALLQTHCSRITLLEVDPMLDIEALRLLTELPALQHLSISLPQEDFPEAKPSFTLNSVTMLVAGGTWTNLSTLLDSVRLPSMQTLSVTGWAYGEPAAQLAKCATQCFRTLSAKHSSITSLSISAAFGRTPPSQGCVVYGVSMVRDAFEATFLDLAHPLLSLSALRDLSLSFPSYFDLTCTAACLRAFAESFPALEELHLRIWLYNFGTHKKGNPVPQDRPRGGPLDAIAYFARNCPRLRSLHLPPMELAEGLLVAPDGDSEEHPSEPHGLRTLVIPKVLLPAGQTHLVEKVSEVVRRVFPLVASPFRAERIVMDGDWAVIDGASRCPECWQHDRL